MDKSLCHKPAHSLFVLHCRAVERAADAVAVDADGLDVDADDGVGPEAMGFVAGVAAQQLDLLVPLAPADVIGRLVVVLRKEGGSVLVIVLCEF